MFLAWETQMERDGNGIRIHTFFQYKIKRKTNMLGAHLDGDIEFCKWNRTIYTKGKLNQSISICIK